VQGTAPFEHASLKAAPAQILMTFTEAVDPSLVNGGTVALQRVDSAAHDVAATAAIAPDNFAVLMITPSAALEPGVYRVTVRGTGAAAFASMSGATLGANSQFEFTVEPAQ
jgi:methionine-rich copper-binding protein CopC